MDSSSKRETILPNRLWSQRGVANAEQYDFDASDIDNSTGGSTNWPRKVFGKNHSTRLGIPIKSDKQGESLATSKESTLDEYHKVFSIDQAGRGMVALKDTENLPVYLIKDCGTHKSRHIRGLKFASHRNLVSLIDYFQSEVTVHLIYEYEHLAVSLGCVAGTVQFTEADIATTCKEILEGLKFIHSALRTSYGLLDFSNILLTWQGEVKLANIGECLLNSQASSMFQKDFQAIGSIVMSLNDRTITFLEASSGINTLSLSKLAHTFVQKTNEDTSVEQLVDASELEVRKMEKLVKA
ncbi:hypothetical protein N7508_007172 [Penicillium antarcticum]|uniref:uncharacterized protein n=1 Tax=Penicillium antarcticum TaxID=416450 RepID=UPI0023867D42|nr:uncharacterized protein N7508_007172 [Penicillium antarcticum]KAJ5302309.1 hypothetical protein N7508_007172 [Penicillium antarcticum]